MDRPASSDAQPDPEPAVPSLTDPDPEIFHHFPVPSPGLAESIPPSQSEEKTRA